ncbi:hypothetical protein PG985_006765 [Apiospora marii]|uniref:uncharacterized protein n=1 Tax=Apiospora marii TaxID=335849 RepID=UPI003131146B
MTPPTPSIMLRTIIDSKPQSQTDHRARGQSRGSLSQRMLPRMRILLPPLRVTTTGSKPRLRLSLPWNTIPHKKSQTRTQVKSPVQVYNQRGEMRERRGKRGGKVEEVVRPDSIERPTTSLSFHPEDEQHGDDDDREVAAPSPTIDITKEYQLPQRDSDVTSEWEAVQDGAPETEVAVEENVEVIPVVERTTEKPPRPRRQQRPDTLSRDKRNELMELRSKLKLLHALREREKRESQLDVDSSSTTTTTITTVAAAPPQQEQDAIDSNEVSRLSDERRAELMELRSKLQLLQELREREKQESRQDRASSSTATTASPQKEQEAASSDELSELSDEKRAELMELRRKLILLMEMRELEGAPESAPVETSVPVSTVQEEEREEVEEDELTGDTNQEFSMSRFHEPTDSDPETVNNDDEIPPSPPPPPEDPPEEEEYYHDGDDGLIDPLSSDADEAMNFVKGWLLLPDDLSALEVLYQVANLRDTLTFIPGWVPTKHSLVRNDESLLVRSQAVPYEINWHFLVRLRSVRWRELLRAGTAVVDAADQAWLEGFLDEMEAPAFAFGGPRELHRRRGRSRGRSNSPRPGTPAVGGGGEGGLHRRRSTLHQVEAAVPPLPHEEEAARVMNQTLWTRHGLEAATAAVRAIYDNTEERVAWIDDRAVEVLTELEEMEQVLQRLLDTLTSLDADVGATVEVHGQEYAQMAGMIQQGLP